MTQRERLSRDELEREVHALGWYHSIDLGDGIRTPGLSKTTPLGPGELPPLEGRSVLDIGAWDGYYSYLAERAGAARVVALDHYAWGVDIAARQAYWDRCAAEGALPDQGKDTTEFWRPELPGKRGFDLANRALDSSVESVVGDFSTMDLDPLGTFDVVLYLGVLYHIKDPLGALERVRSVTRQVAVIETEAIAIPGYESSGLMQFFPGGELNADFGNWYVPTMDALRGLCRAAGFSRVEPISGPPSPPSSPSPSGSGASASSAAAALAAKVASLPWREAVGVLRGAGTPGALTPYRAVVHAFV
jgi:tRNA (mo5U34)-methyltransferase